MDKESDKVDTATIRSAAAAIWRYLDEHPNSADSIEGVAEWWLARQRIQETLTVVGAALDLLTSTGAVRQHRTANGRVIYSRVAKEVDGG